MLNFIATSIQTGLGLAKATKAAYVISQLFLAYHTSIPISRLPNTLVVKAIIGCGLPDLQSTNSQFMQLDSVLARPMRKILQLPPLLVYTIIESHCPPH